jgi:hypothetical protein
MSHSQRKDPLPAALLLGAATRGNGQLRPPPACNGDWVNSKNIRERPKIFAKDVPVRFAPVLGPRGMVHWWQPPSTFGIMY